VADPPSLRQPSVRVRRGLGDSRRPITLIEVEGDQVYDGRADLASALVTVDGHVIVDLTHCGYIDKALIAALLQRAVDLGRRGHRFELVVPPSGPLARTVDVLGLRDVVWVRDDAPAG
jgi:anti-anti-sigma regulatory factor